MIATIIITALLATTPAPPQPSKQMVLQQTMLAEPTEFYSLSGKKKRK